MGYQDVLCESAEPLGNVITAIADKAFWGFRRNATVIGWGLICVAAPVTLTVHAALNFQYSSQGAAFVVKDGPATLTATQETLGASFERSSLLKARSPVAPNSNMDPFDVLAGDLVKVSVTTAEAATTPGKYMAFILWIPKGSA